MISFLIFLATYLIMECVTWCTHNFVMHGFLWYLNADHHQPKLAHIFERNDLFFVLFAIPSMLLFIFGSSDGFDDRFFIDLGILAYGLSYFIVHYIIIHQGFKLFKNTENKYLLAVGKGHKVHHKHLGKEDGECFEMLFVLFKYFKI